MASTSQKANTLPARLWALGCSLKLAIALASAATILIMAGSLVMHYNPLTFAGMEQDIMARWLPQAWAQAPLLVSWIPLSGLLVLLLAVNTLCCLIDWLTRFKARWRKSGEYLIHAGFILLVIAYTWGNMSGFRSDPQRVFPGERIQIAGMPGYALQLDEFTPQLEPSGRPLDMINQVTLWRDDVRLATAEVRINHPLMHDGLVILPTSFGQDLTGFRFHLPGHGFIDLAAGSRLSLSAETSLVIDALLPDAQQTGQGRVVPRGSQVNNPAMLLSLWSPTEQLWQGWYFLRQPLPVELRQAGLAMRPIEPLYRTFSLLTINRDPGDKLALSGGLLMTIGVIFACFSFYRKRAQGDRPEV